MKHRLPFRNVFHPVALRIREEGEPEKIDVYHLSTPAHLGIFLENFLGEHPGLTALVRSHLLERDLAEAEPVLRRLEEEGRLVFRQPGNFGGEIPAAAIMLHSRRAQATRLSAAKLRLEFHFARARHKYIIGGDGAVWNASLRATALRRISAPFRRLYFSWQRNSHRRAVEAGLERLGRELALHHSGTGGKKPPGRIPVASRPMLLWADAETGSLHRDPGMSPEEEQEMYDSAYHGRVYIDERRDWDGLLREYQNRRWHNIAAVVPPGRLDRRGDALDIGCGTGGLCDLLRQRGYSVTGIERSPQMIDTCLHNFPQGIEFRAVRMETLAEEGRRFNLVTLSHVLEHIEDAAGFLRNAGRLLARQGVLYVEVPLFVNDPEIMAMRPDWIWQRDHYHEFTRAGLAAVAERAGLRILQHRDSLKAPGNEPYQFLAATSPQSSP